MPVKEDSRAPRGQVKRSVSIFNLPLLVNLVYIRLLFKTIGQTYEKLEEEGGNIAY